LLIQTGKCLVCQPPIKQTTLTHLKCVRVCQIHISHIIPFLPAISLHCQQGAVVQ
jgi:hypothetical protein